MSIVQQVQQSRRATQAQLRQFRETRQAQARQFQTLLRQQRSDLRQQEENRHAQARQQREAQARERSQLGTRVHAYLRGYDEAHRGTPSTPRPMPQAQGEPPQGETPPAPPRPRHGGAPRRQNGG